LLGITSLLIIVLCREFYRSATPQSLQINKYLVAKE